MLYLYGVPVFAFRGVTGSSTASTRRHSPQPTRDESPSLKGYRGTLPGSVVTRTLADSMSRTSDVYNSTQGCVLYVILGNLGEKYNRQRKVRTTPCCKDIVTQ